MKGVALISVQLITHWVWLGADQYKYHVREREKERKRERGERTEVKVFGTCKKFVDFVDIDIADRYM